MSIRCCIDKGYSSTSDYSNRPTIASDGPVGIVTKRVTIVPNRVGIVHIVALIGIWTGGLIGPVHAQTQVQVGEALQRLGMENIQVATTTGRRVTVAFEDNVYRSTYKGIGEAIKVALSAIEHMELELVVLDNGVPQLYINIPQEMVSRYQVGELDISGVFAAMRLSYDTDNAMKRLQGVSKTLNRSQWKTDIVVYPGVTLENFRLDRIYSYSIDLSPAIELSPWKGAKLTAQVVFPIATNMQGEYKKIRAGVLALRQEYRIPGNFQGYVTAGNFTDNRFGGQTGIGFRTANGRLELGASAGATAYSGILSDEGWYISSRFRIDGAVKASVYEPHYNLQFDLQAARYVFGDYGLRADCTRHFGECAIGLYGMVMEGGIVNGGFHFTLPLPGRKWNRRQAIRLRPAAYFAAEYSREPTGRYIKERMGYTYDTRPDENRSEHYYQPEYIRYFLLKDKR